MTAIVIGAQVIVLTSCVVFAISLVVKAWRLLIGRAAYEPILRAQWLRPSLAPAALSLIAFVEGGTLLFLILVPSVGLPLVGALLLVYGAILSRRPANDDCGCLGEIAPMTNRQALFRNLVLAILALLGSAVAVGHDLARNILTQTTVGVTLVALAALVGTAHILKVRRLISEGGS